MELVVGLPLAHYGAPYEQLVGCLQTGQEYYITRHNGAREKVRLLDKAQIRKYIDEKYKKNDKLQHHENLRDCSRIYDGKLRLK